MIVLAILLFLAAFYALLHQPRRHGRRPQQGNGGAEDIGYAGQGNTDPPWSHGSHHDNHGGDATGGDFGGHH